MIQRKMTTAATKIAPLRTRFGRCRPGTISIRWRHVRFWRGPLPLPEVRSCRSIVDMSSVPGRVGGAVGLALERLALGGLPEAGRARAVDARRRVWRVVDELVVRVPAAGRRDLVDVRRLADRLLGAHGGDQEADHVVEAVAELDV